MKAAETRCGISLGSALLFAAMFAKDIYWVLSYLFGVLAIVNSICFVKQLLQLILETRVLVSILTPENLPAPTITVSR